jgi:hypothetical protein
VSKTIKSQSPAAAEASIKHATKALEDALAERSGIDDMQSRAASISRSVAEESKKIDLEVAPRDAYATLLTLFAMGYTLIPTAD